MALPKQSAPKYNCILPSDGKEIEFRPFLVKEQKVLLLAQEQEDERAMFNAVKELIESVCFTEIKADRLSVVDMEYLFLKIRSKSVGETATISVTCNDPKCDGHGETVINLDDVEVVGESPENKIMINDEIGIELRYPRVSDINAVQGMDSANSTLTMLKSSMVNIYDADEVYPTMDASTNELNEFVENLTMQQLEMITDYFNSIPALQHDVKTKCTTCEKDIRTTVKGLNSFF
jgi:hypothetical protein